MIYALSLACCSGQGADPNFVAGTGDSAVSYAAYADNRLMVELLYEYGGDLKAALRILQERSPQNPVQAEARERGMTILKSMFRSRSSA